MNDLIDALLKFINQNPAFRKLNFKFEAISQSGQHEDVVIDISFKRGSEI